MIKEIGRGERHKLFRKGSKLTAELYNRPVHVREQETGEWRESSLTPFKDADDLLCVHCVRYKTTVLSESVGVKVDCNGSWFKVSLCDYDHVEPEIDNTGHIRWVLPDNIDIVLDCRNNGIEFFKIIKTVDAPKTFVWQVSYEQFVGKQLLGNITGEMLGWDALNRQLVCSRVISDMSSNGFTVTEKWEPKVYVNLRDKTYQYDDAVYPLTVDIPEISVSTDSNVETFEQKASYSTSSSVAPNPFSWYGFTYFDANFHYNQITVDAYNSAKILPPYFGSVGYFSASTGKHTARIVFENQVIPPTAHIDSAVLSIPFDGITDKRTLDLNGYGRPYQPPGLSTFNLTVVAEQTPSRMLYGVPYENIIADDTSVSETSKYRKDVSIQTGWFSDYFISNGGAPTPIQSRPPSFSVEKGSTELHLGRSSQNVFWEVKEGQVVVDGGTNGSGAYVAGMSTPSAAMAVVDSGAATSILVSCTVCVGPGAVVSDAQGIIVRFVDINNYLMVVPDIGTGWKLVKVVGGVTTVLQTTTAHPPQSPTSGFNRYMVNIILDDDTILVFVDTSLGFPSYSNSDMSHMLSQTEHGLFNNSQTYHGIKFPAGMTSSDSLFYRAFVVNTAGFVDVDITEIVQSLVDQGESKWDAAQLIQISMSTKQWAPSSIAWNTSTDDVWGGGSKAVFDRDATCKLTVDYSLAQNRYFDYEVEIAKDDPVFWLNPTSSTVNKPVLPFVPGVSNEFWFQYDGQNTTVTPGVTYDWPQRGYNLVVSPPYLTSSSSVKKPSFKDYTNSSGAMNNQSHIKFDGVDDVYSLVSGKLNFGQSSKTVTVIAVVQVTSTSTATPLFGSITGDKWGVSTNSSGQWVLQGGSTSATAGTVTTQPTLLRAVFTPSGNDSLYVNEQKIVDYNVGSSDITGPNTDFRIGYDGTSYGDFGIAYMAVIPDVEDVTAQSFWDDFLKWCNDAFNINVGTPSDSLYDRVYNIPIKLNSVAKSKNGLTVTSGTRSVGDIDSLNGLLLKDKAGMTVTYQDSDPDKNWMTPAFEINKTKRYTVEAWFKPFVSSVDQPVVRWYTYGFELGIKSGGQIYGGHYDSSNVFWSVQSSTGYDDSGWHHAAVIYDGSTLSLMVDRKVVATVSVSNQPFFVSSATSASTDGLGLGVDNVSKGLSGELGDVVVYDHALDYGRIQKHYDTTRERLVGFGEFASGAGILHSNNS